MRKNSLKNEKLNKMKCKNFKLIKKQTKPYNYILETTSR